MVHADVAISKWHEQGAARSYGLAGCTSAMLRVTWLLLIDLLQCLDCAWHGHYDLQLPPAHIGSRVVIGCSNDNEVRKTLRFAVPISLDS